MKRSILTSCSALFATMLVASCGGDGGSNPSNTSENLSANQQSYESFALAKNGGLHYLEGALSFTTTSSGVSIAPSSTFFTSDYSVAQSPGTTGSVAQTIGSTSLDAALAEPVAVSRRHVINGSVVVTAAPAQAQISYPDGNVQETLLASDGKTPTETILGTSYTTVPLSGTIADSPTELFSGSSVGLITNKINGTSLYNTSSTWQSGAAYLKVVRHVVGDTLLAGDCTLTATTGVNPTPCPTSASVLENFFPYTGVAQITYNLSDGQIVTLAGVRAWVANAPLANVASTEYRVFYQSNGQIFVGVLDKDGATLQLASGSTTPQDFYIFLNQAAVQSIRSAITF